MVRLVQTHPIKTLRDPLNATVKNPEWHPVTSASEEMEDGIPNPLGKVMIEEMPLETRAEDEDFSYS